MKKRKYGVIIVALVMILIGFCLFVGGIVAAGGVSAAKDALFQHEVNMNPGFHFELDEDGIEFDWDEDDGRFNFTI